MFNIDNDIDYLIVAFGTAARISKGVIAMAKEKIGLFRPIVLWPFPYEKLKELSKLAKRIFVFELNLNPYHIFAERKYTVQFY